MLKHQKWLYCSCPILCLQRLDAKLVSGLLYPWSLMRNNNTAFNLLICPLQVTVVGVLPHVTRALTEGFFCPDLLFVDLGVGLIMKNRVKSVFYEVINSSATSMCSIIQRQLYITMFTCAHQVRKYAYRKQNAFNRFHILI